MIPAEQLARIALRYETTMSDAMLRALGVERPVVQHSHRNAHRKRGMYDGMDSCRNQKHGVRL